MIVCEVCETEITPLQASVQKVVGWVAVKNGKANGPVMRPSAPLGYAHKVCLEVGKAQPRLDSLF